MALLASSNPEDNAQTHEALHDWQFSETLISYRNIH